MDGSLQLWAAVGETLQSPIRHARRIPGGDVAQAFMIRLADGRSLFCKTHPRPKPGAFEAEAAGLQFLRTEDGPRIPEVVAIQDQPQSHSFLVLEPIQIGRHTTKSETRMGEALAALHSQDSESRFGYPESNYIGTLIQDNQWLDSWATFFVERRLWPQVLLAQRSLGRSLMRTLETVAQCALTELETQEAPCRLHGDLWSGNRMVDQQGESWLIDPAVFYGNRELDLAMMRLFGGFEDACFDAYKAVAPLPPGEERRAEFYQLYYMLVHLNLHGPSWAGQVAQLAWGLS